MNAALYLYDPRTVIGLSPSTAWGRQPTGRCLAYAHRTGRDWTVRDLRTGRTTSVATRTDAAQYLAGLAAANPTLTVGGAA